MKLTLLQKTGLVVFGIGVVFIFAVGWFYSWWMVPAIREHGFQNIPVPGIVSFIWGLSTPVGALIVLAGAGMYAQVPFHRILVLAPGIFVVVFLVAVLAPSTMRPVLFGIDGGLMSLLFVGILWQWGKKRPSLSAASQTVSDLRMAGYVFFLSASWYLCGLLGAPAFTLRPELLQRYGTLPDAIQQGSLISILLVLGWALMFLSCLVKTDTSNLEV
jgi:hypothetical protein